MPSVAGKHLWTTFCSLRSPRPERCRSKPVGKTSDERIVHWAGGGSGRGQGYPHGRGNRAYSKAHAPDTRAANAGAHSGTSRGRGSYPFPDCRGLPARDGRGALSKLAPPGGVCHSRTCEWYGFGGALGASFRREEFVLSY